MEPEQIHSNAWDGPARDGIHPYYDTAGNENYVLITGFNKTENIIKLKKVTGAGFAISALNYSLNVPPNGSGTRIYIDKLSSQPELIAILPDVAPGSISLNGSYLSYSS